MMYAIAKYVPGERVIVRELGFGRVRVPAVRDRIAVTLDSGLDLIARLDAVERVPSR